MMMDDRNLYQQPGKLYATSFYRRSAVSHLQYGQTVYTLLLVCDVHIKRAVFKAHSRLSSLDTVLILLYCRGITDSTHIPTCQAIICFV